MGWFAAVLFVAVLAASLVGTRLVLWLLRRRSILDLPNERSSHRVATPRGGGLAVVPVLIVAWLAIGYAGTPDQARASLVLGGAALGLGALSWIDDLKGLAVAWRLVAQAGVVAAALLGVTRRRALSGRPPADRLRRRGCRPVVAVVHQPVQFHGRHRRPGRGRDRLPRRRRRRGCRRRRHGRRHRAARPCGPRRGPRLPVVELAAGAHLPRRRGQRSPWASCSAGFCSTSRPGGIGPRP